MQKCCHDYHPWHAKHKEIKEATDTHTLATNGYSMIEGGIFMSLITSK